MRKKMNVVLGEREGGGGGVEFAMFKCRTDELGLREMYYFEQ